MPFYYEKNRHHEDQSHFWTSYSDLLLGMSVIFLLLYVTASLTSGTSGMQTQLENQKLTREIQDLKNQLKAYESLRQDYLNNQATEDEKQQYMDLLDKLTLLEEESKSEQERIKKALREEIGKQKALNQYQQMVRNLINVNTFTKAKVARREEVIQDQDEKLAQQKQLISNLSQQIAQTESEKDKLQQELQANLVRLQNAYKSNQLTKAQYEKQIQNLKEQNDTALMALEQQAQSLKGALAKAQAELNQLGQELQSTQALAAGLGKELASARSAAAQKEAEVQKLAGQLGSAQKQVAKLQEELNARKKVAESIRRNFAKKGIKAEILDNGDVIIDFGDSHFDNDSAALKPKMKAVLHEAIPTYADSLFSNPETRDKISSIEIIGFASPTYKGRFIDPNSDLKKDKEALAYNMDLSYKRARSIYEYMFHNPQVSFTHQQKMLPMVKVSARSFLEMFDEKRRPANFEQYCKVNDCSKARRVMIRFNVNSGSK